MGRVGLIGISESRHTRIKVEAPVRREPFVTTATVLGTTRETVVTVVDRGQINDGARVVIAHPRIDHTVNNNNGPRLRLKNQTSRETRETYRVPW